MNNFFLLFLGFFILASSDVQAAKIFGLGSKDHDVVLLVSPISTKDMRPGQRVDAIAGSPSEPALRHAVVFKIERVLVGEIAKVKRGGVSQLDQMGSALKEHKFLGIFETKSPLEEQDRELFVVAVQNSGETFGFAPGETPPGLRFKLYLKRISKKPEAFQLVKARPVNSTAP